MMDQRFKSRHAVFYSLLRKAYLTSYLCLATEEQEAPECAA